MRAIGFVTRADRPQAANDLVELLAREELTNVVASRRAATSPLLKRLLREQGFRPVVQRSRFSLFVRNPGSTRSDGVEPEGPPSS